MKVLNSKKKRLLLQVILVSVIIVGVINKHQIGFHEKMNVLQNNAKVVSEMPVWDDLRSKIEGDHRPTISLAQTDGVVDKHLIDETNWELEKLPETMLQAFQDDGWTIFVTDRDLNQEMYDNKYQNVLGSANWTKKQIHIEDYEEAVQIATLHEMGHWLDWHCNTISQTERFKKIYQKEKKTLTDTFPGYVAENEKEFFAEGFYQYIERPATLQKYVPELYRYIEQTASVLS